MDTNPTAASCAFLHSMNAAVQTDLLALMEVMMVVTYRSSDMRGVTLVRESLFAVSVCSQFLQSVLAVCLTESVSVHPIQKPLTSTDRLSVP